MTRLAVKPRRAMPWAELIAGTLVMGDISGFTAMSERLASCGREGAEQLTDIINSFFGHMLDIAFAYGGDTLAFGGDAMLLLFAGPQHVERAAAASLAMLDATQRLEPYRVRGAKIKLGMSMGAHAAPFPFVAAGSGERAQFMVLGPDTVRTAEAESAASSGELVVTETTAAASPGLEIVPVADGLVRVVSVATPDPWCGESTPREHSDRLARSLSPFLPPFAAETLARGEPAPVLDSDHRRATVVFVNVLGVDDLLREGLPVIAEELQRYLDRLLEVMTRNGGYLVSNDIYTDGFKLILTFGAPVAREHDVADAVRFVAEFAQEAERAGTRLRHRFGINHGSVFSGDVGPSGRRQYTVMGDAVNLAARLMSAAEPGTALTTCEVAGLAGEGFSVRLLEPIRVKGKSKPIDVCMLQGEERADRGLATEPTRIPLFGRTSEMAALRASTERARHGEDRVVLLLGEPGIGKSRVSEEFLRECRAGGLRVLSGVCYERTSSSPFSPWMHLMGALLELGESGTPRERGLRIQERVVGLIPSGADLACLLGPMLHAEMHESERVRALDVEMRREALFDLVGDLFVAAARREPLLLFLEDAHWADSSSLELLGSVRERLAGSRVLLLITSRVGYASEAGLVDMASEIVELKELAPDAAIDLVAAVVGLEQLPEPFASTLLEKSRGNPLFLEEVARTLVQTGAVERMRGASRVVLERELAELEFPDRVQGLLMSRIDLLDVGARETLKTAAVIGAAFDVESLDAITRPSELASTPPPTLLSEIDRLTRLEFLEPDEAGGVSGYRFRHPLIQEVAYGSLRFSRRRDLHRRMAEYLEEAHPANLEPYLDALVLHHGRSGNNAKTLFFSVKAAERADGLGAHQEAVDYYRIGLSSERSGSVSGVWMRSQLLERIGDTLEVWGRHAEAIDSYRDALRRWGRIESRALVGAPPPAALQWDTPAVVRRATLCLSTAVSYEHGHRRYDLAERWLRAALAALPEACTSERAQIYITQGFLLMRQGHCAEALAAGRQGLEAALECGDTAQQAWAHTMLGGCSRLTGDLGAAVQHGRESIVRFEKLGDLRRLAVAEGNLASCLQGLGELDEAIRHNVRSLEIEERIGSAGQAAVTHANIGEILIMQGKYAEAIQQLDEALEEARASETAALEGFVLLNLSKAWQGEGDLGRATGCADESVLALQACDAESLLAEAHLQQAALQLAVGRAEEAQRIAEGGLREAEVLGMKVLEAQANRVLGEAAASLGDTEGAERSLAHSIEIAEETGAKHEHALALLALGECRKGAQPTDTVDRSYEGLLREAAEMLREIGAAADEKRALDALESRHAPRPSVADEARSSRVSGLGSSSAERAENRAAAAEEGEQVTEEEETRQAAQVEGLALGGLLRRYPAGTVLFAEGDNADGMYIVRSGSVRVFRTRRRKESTLQVLEAGDFFGERALFDRRVRSASVEVVDDAELEFITREELEARITDPFVWDMLVTLARRIRYGGDWLEKAVKGSAGQPGGSGSADAPRPWTA